MALPMLDPDEDGVWRCKLTPSVYAIFDRDDDGEVTTLWIHEVVKMRKTADAEQIDAGVPTALHGHLGTYLLTQINMEFTATWRDGALAMRQGDSGGFSRLREDPDEPGSWISTATDNRIPFDLGPDGNVVGLTLDSASRIVRR